MYLLHNIIVRFIRKHHSRVMQHLPTIKNKTLFKCEYVVLLHDSGKICYSTLVQEELLLIILHERGGTYIFFVQGFNPS